MSLQNPSTLSTLSGPPRMASVAVPQSRRDQHVSHQMDPSHEATDISHPAAPLPDVFSHPAVIAWVANHPNRPLPKFGAYYMLQTLGEGEFGKVKLGLHSKYGEEVAVKLIRRETADNEGKMAKIAREIEILDMLKHPNIVRLYDVIETDKFFGIILEYASGGELFDHILAHRYLRERDACRLFSQLISGVWYMHSKNIVHRDLKLENLLLDRNRNLIITDFGFANHFSRNRNDLMETMCGSPCYAAPELVNSDGLYVGTAADVWSCGVILFAMCAGYLPFDDDPTNPDGNDITKLYAYIARTPLSFPEHLSEQACNLLGAMLVPDPQKRADLGTVMRHPWFSVNAREPTTFGLTVMELEKLAEEGPTSRRLAYQRKANKVDVAIAPQTSRSPARSRKKRNAPPEVSEFSEAPNSGSDLGDDPFARTASPLKDMVGSPRRQRGAQREKSKEREREESRKDDKFRHTIQIEYGERQRARDRPQSSSRGQSERTPAKQGTDLPVDYDGAAGGSDEHFIARSPTKDRRQRVSRLSGTNSGSPAIASGLPISPLESTAEIPSSGQSLGRSPRGEVAHDENRPTSGRPRVQEMHRDLDAFYKNQPTQSHLDTGTTNSNKARALLAPLIIDSSANASSSKQPFTQSAHPTTGYVGTQVSPSKPNKVMQWFRRGRRSITTSGGLTPSPFSPATPDAAASSVEVSSIPHGKTTPSQRPGPFLVTPGTSEHRQRTTSAVSITSLFRRSAGVTASSGGNRAALRVHHGAVDHEMITTGRPPEVMQHMLEVLSRMGVDVQVEGDFKYRCSRPPKRRDRRDVSGENPTSGGGGGVFRGLLSRRQPSPARPPLQENDSTKSSLSADQPSHSDTVYGDISEDVGDEVRFSVELTRLDRLKDTYSLDIRRLKGNLKSYKFLYDTIRMRADLQR